MGKIKRFILSRFTDSQLKSELKKRGYAIDLTMTFTQDGKPTELQVIGKHPIMKFKKPKKANP